MPSIKMMTVLIISIFAISCSKQDFVVPPESVSYPQTITYNNKVDIIFMIDNSQSMGMYQTRLANEVQSVLAKLDEYEMDYNIVVTTSDVRNGGNGGQFIGNPKVLNKTSSNLVSELQSRILAGQTGSTLERGVQSIKTTMSPSYLQGAGSGFLRDDAFLAIIALSNEDDKSSGNFNDDIAFFDQLKPPQKTNEKNWILNFVGVLEIDSTCQSSSSSDFKEPGLRWLKLAEYTGGKSSSICESSFAQSVENVQKRILQIMTDFQLGSKPNLSTLKVYVNNSLVKEDKSNGWEYIAETNIIRFHGESIPKASDKIGIEYTSTSGR